METTYGSARPALLVEYKDWRDKLETTNAVEAVHVVDAFRVQLRARLTLEPERHLLIRSTGKEVVEAAREG